jgi:hypothetical protein
MGMEVQFISSMVADALVPKDSAPA